MPLDFVAPDDGAGVHPHLSDTAICTEVVVHKQVFTGDSHDKGSEVAEELQTTGISAVQAIEMID